MVIGGQPAFTHKLIHAWREEGAWRDVLQKGYTNSQFLTLQAMLLGRRKARTQGTTESLITQASFGIGNSQGTHRESRHILVLFFRPLYSTKFWLCTIWFKHWCKREEGGNICFQKTDGTPSLYKPLFASLCCSEASCNDTYRNTIPNLTSCVCLLQRAVSTAITDKEDNRPGAS